MCPAWCVTPSGRAWFPRNRSLPILRVRRAATDLECEDLSALSAGDLSPSHPRRCPSLPGRCTRPLLWRQVAKAAKAVTIHRAPNSCRWCAKFHRCSLKGAESEFLFTPSVPFYGCEDARNCCGSKSHAPARILRLILPHVVPMGAGNEATEQLVGRATRPPLVQQPTRLLSRASPLLVRTSRPHDWSQASRLRYQVWPPPGNGRFVFWPRPSSRAGQIHSQVRLLNQYER